MALSDCPDIKAVPCSPASAATLRVEQLVDAADKTSSAIRLWCVAQHKAGLQALDEGWYFAAFRQMADTVVVGDSGDVLQACRKVFESSAGRMMALSSSSVA